MNMFDLPSDVLTLIFDFDGTRKNIFDRVIEELEDNIHKRCFCMSYIGSNKYNVKVFKKSYIDNKVKEMVYVGNSY